jgi:hypothetical protein
MKSIRIAALTLALGAFSICSLPVQAQQEVDPDHFDQPSVAPAHVQGSPAQSHHKAMANQHHSNVKLASKHFHKTHHHHQASA